jgi:hypothetical protein
VFMHACNYISMHNALCFQDNIFSFGQLSIFRNCMHVDLLDPSVLSLEETFFYF